MKKTTISKTRKSAPASDWRGKTMTRIRVLIPLAAPAAGEEVKYRTPSNPAGVFVWYLDGMLCTCETYAQHLRISFAKGPVLKAHDPKGILNTYRAMVVREGDKVNEPAFKKLVRAAAMLNMAAKKRK